MTRLFGDAYASVSDPYLRRASISPSAAAARPRPTPSSAASSCATAQVVGEGWHERAGGPHAEIVALQAARRRRARRHRLRHPRALLARRAHAAMRARARARGRLARWSSGWPTPSRRPPEAPTCSAPPASTWSSRRTPGPSRRSTRSGCTGCVPGGPFVRVKIALTLDGQAESRARRAQRHHRAERPRPDACAFAPRPTRARRHGHGGRGRPRADRSRRRRCSRDRVSRAAYVLTPHRAAVRRRHGCSTTALGPVGAAGARRARPRARAEFRRGARRRAGTPPAVWPTRSARSPTTGSSPCSWRPARGCSASLAVYGLIDELVLLPRRAASPASEAPALYVGESQEDPATLQRDFRAVEAGVVGE